MEVIIDLADVPAGERGERWARAVRGEYVDVDVRFPGLVYPTGRITRSWIGAVSVSSFAGSSHIYERSQAMADGDRVDWLVGALQLKGHARVSQAGRETDLDPGQMLLFDAADAGRIDLSDDHNIVFLTIPRAFFTENAARMQGLLNIRVEEGCGSTLILNYFRHIMDRHSGLTTVQRAEMGMLGVELLVGATAASAGLAAGPVMRDGMLVFDRAR